MPRADFEKNLQQVQDDIVKLSSMVEKSISKSVEALKARDLDLSCLLYTSPSPRDRG